MKLDSPDNLDGRTFPAASGPVASVDVRDTVRPVASSPDAIHKAVNPREARANLPTTNTRERQEGESAGELRGSGPSDRSSDATDLSAALHSTFSPAGALDCSRDFPGASSHGGGHHPGGECGPRLQGFTEATAETPRRFFTARQIARALGVSKPTVRERANREGWWQKQELNRDLFAPPPEIAALIPEPAAEAAPREVAFSQLANPEERARALARAAAVNFCNNLTRTGTPKEVALVRTADHFRTEPQPFEFSPRSLREWIDQFALHGLNGLVPQRQGKVGRKPPVIPEELLAGARAAAIAHGTAERPNFAAGRKYLVRHPEATAEMREWLHEARVTNSHCPEWLKRQLRVSTQGMALLLGPKHARLASPHTPCDWSNVPAGRLLTGDDMTMNLYAWCEWPNQLGYLVIRPQLIAFLDCGSLRFVGARVVMRARGQYNKDDVWGGLGDIFDRYGIFPEILFEGGTWRSNVIVGERTGIHDEERFGGLQQFGIKLHHSRTPRSKPIEERFNQLQYVMDDTPGWCGRGERETRPEKLTRLLGLMERGVVHPREHLLHVSQVRAHIEQSFNALNGERSDGKILRGSSPDEKWRADNPQLAQFPDHAKWLYRGARNVSQVLRDGRVKVSVSSGKHAVHHYYDAPAILKARAGQRVVVYWDDRCPEADAAIMLPTGPKTAHFLGMAKYWPMAPRLDATDEQMAEQARLKQAHASFARAEVVRIEPHLRRGSGPATFAPPSFAPAVGDAMRAAGDQIEAQREQQARQQKAIRQALRKAPALDDSLPAPDRGELPISAERVNELIGEDPFE